MGYDVDETATRLSGYLLVLRELVHLSCGHLALEPRFEVKALLGDHLHDDARAVSKLHRRLYELRPPGDPGAPSDELAAVLDRANGVDTQEYLEIAYGELKPTLIAALGIHLANLDPLLDEPSLRVLTQLVHRQARHVAELPAAGTRTVLEELGAPRLRQQRALKVMPPLDRPQRDAFVMVTDDSDPPPGDDKRLVHGLMHTALCAAELTARNSHEHPDMPWEFHADMARRCWDEIRHAEILDRLMATELECQWGDYPVAFASFRTAYALDLPGRLAPLDWTGEPVSGQERVFEYLRADAVPHAHNRERWSR